MEPEGSLPLSQMSVTCPYPERPFPLLRSYQNISPGSRLYLWIFCNKILLYAEELSAPRPTPKLEDHPLSADHDCLFNTFKATLHIGGGSFIRNPRTRHAVLTGTHLSPTHSTSHSRRPDILRATKSKPQSPSWEANSYRASQLNSHLTHPRFTAAYIPARQVCLSWAR